MKNIKKLLNKNLSVILSFAIVLCTILPVVGSFIGKADSAYDSALVANLKTAWKALTPSETIGDRVDTTLLNYAAVGADYLSTEVPSDVRANPTSVKVPIGTKATQLLQFGDEVGTNKVTAAKRTEIDDIYFYYKSTSDVYLRVNISYTDGVSDLVGAASPFSGLFKVASSNGNWTKVSIPDFINGASSGAWANRYKPGRATCEYYSKIRLEFSTTNALDTNNGNPNVADIYVSNIFFNYDSNIYGSDSWTDEQWIMAASNANINELKNDYTDGINNTDKWTTFVAAREAVLDYADELLKSQAVENLKTAWKALTPSETIGDRVDTTLLNYAAVGADYLSTEVPSDVRANPTSVKVPIGTKATQLLQFGDEVGTNKVTAAKRTEIDDIYFYYKSTSDVYLRVNISYTDGVSDLVGAASPFSGLFKVASSNGNWTKVSIPDFINGASSGAWANRYKPGRATCEYYSKIRLEFSTTNALDTNNGNPNVADIYVSNIFFNYDSNIYGSDSWTDEQWIMAASNANINELKNDYTDGINNTDKWTTFVAAFDAVKSYSEQPGPSGPSGPSAEEKVAQLKEALNNLVIRKTLVPTMVGEGWGSGGLIEGTGLNIYDASTYAGTDIDKAELGSKYATYSNTSASASDMAGFIVYEFEGEENESLNLGRWDSFTFYIKADPSLAAIRPKFGVPTSSGKGFAEDTFAFTAAALGNNEWKKVTLDNVNSLSGFSNILTRTVFGVGLDLSGVANVTVGSMVAEFNALDGATMALAESNPTAFLKAAMEFYDEANLNGYFAEDDANFKAFSAALTAATGLTEDERKVNQLSTAWKAITEIKTLVPTTVWSENNVVGTGLNIYDGASYPENDINKALLGPKYATYTNTDKSATTNEGFIIYEFTEPNTRLTLGDVSKYSFYAKSSNEITGIRPRYIFSTGMSWDDNSLFTKGEVGSGTFKNLGKSNIASLGGNIPNTLDRVITGIGFDTAGETDLTLGSITMEFGFIKEDIASLAYTDMAAFLSEAIIFYEKATANSWFAADNASFNTFKSILEDVLAAESLEELVTIAKLQAGWKQLSNNSSFPEGDTSNWSIADWVYAANTVDISNLENTEAFKVALNNATVLRDELGTTLGCNFTTYETYADAENDLAALGSNVLLGKTPDIYYYNGVEKTEVEVSGSEFLSDGSADNTFNISHLDFSAEGSYTEFVYEFAGEARVKDFVTAFSSDPELAKMNYRIYIANSMEKLFLTESIVASCNNEDGHQVQKFNYDGRPEISGVYLAFRFYPTSNNLTIGELAAYGEVITYTVKAGKFADEEMKSLGKNILANPETVCYFKVGNGGRVKWQDNNEMNNGYEYSWLVDLSSEKGVGFAAVVGTSITAVGQETTFHIVFDMKENYNIQQILWNQFHQDHLETGKYEVYASTEIATLFREQNKIITYNNMSDSENGTTDTQLFTLAGNGVVARYVSFCIKCPVSDYEKALEQFSGMCYPRLYDLGVFGTRYYKPLAEINFLNHVPVEVYRTDAGGNKTTIKSDEYDGFDYIYAYDGNYDIATPIPQNDKHVNFLFNLCANKSINSIKLSTLTDNIKGLKVYASESEEGVWEENALVLDYYGDAVDEIFRTFGETPIEARYVRFCVTETADGVFNPTEFEVIGWNTQEFTYFNLAEGKSGNTSLWLEDKETFEYYPTTQDAGRYRPRWWSADLWFPLSAAFDGDEATVADIYNGCNGDADGNGKVSVNFLIDLGTLNSVDNIDFISGSSEEFWPSKINFYFGDNDLALFGEDAELKATFNGKTTAENGSYSYTFIPEIAQYVRVEIEESSNEFFTKGNKIASVIADIRVNGLEILANTASEGVAASITDEETGVRVDLVALRENDVYTTLQDILVVKREATDEELNAVKNNGNRFASDVYEVYLLDANGDIIDDVEGRAIRTYLPSSLYNGSSEAFVMSNIWGEFTLVEFTTEDGYFVVTSDDPININYAFCDFIEAPEGDGDEAPPTNTDKPVEDNNDDNESEVEDSEDTESEDEAEEEEDDEEETKKKKKKKIKVVRKPGSDDFDYLWIIIAAAAVVVIAAGVTLFIILAKKKKARQEQQ